MICIADENLLTVEQARELLPGVGEATVWRWVASGKLESLKLGGRRFTSREALQRMAQNGPQKTHAASGPPTHRTQAAAQRVNSRLDRFNNAA